MLKVVNMNGNRKHQKVKCLGLCSLLIGPPEQLVGHYLKQNESLDGLPGSFYIPISWWQGFFILDNRANQGIQCQIASHCVRSSNGIEDLHTRNPKQIYVSHPDRSTVPRTPGRKL